MTVTIQSSDEIRFEQTLYKVHSNNKIGSWSAKVILHEDGLATLVVASQKVLGGKITETPTKYQEGKNLGRSNETTPLMQATFEAQSKIKKKLDSGYVVELPKEGDVATNAAGRAMPMLAKVFESVDKINFPVYVQCKLDGNRMLACCEDGKVIVYSRKGNEIQSCPHVVENLQRLYDNGHWDGRTLDGEIYTHGVPLQTINSWVKKHVPDSFKLIYHIYDVVMPGGYGERLNYLENLLVNNQSDAVCLLKTQVCENEQQLEQMHETAVAECFEGTIIRLPDEEYPTGGKRANQLLKKKDYQDAEFEILGLSEGKPTRNGKKVGIYQCKAENGSVFTVTAPGNEDERHMHAIRGRENIGKKLTVKFFCFTLEGKPSQPTAVAIRDEL